MAKLIHSNKPQNDSKQHNKMTTFSINEISQKENSKDFYWTNLRIDNHQRNFLQALKNIGIAKSQKEALSVLIDSYEENINAEQKAKIQELFNALETADKIKQNA